jgi:hypothetical protein
MDTLPTIKELAAKQFGGDPDAIDPDAPVDQLGIDSLGFLELLFELEDNSPSPFRKSRSPKCVPCANWRPSSMD